MSFLAQFFSTERVLINRLRAAKEKGLPLVFWIGLDGTVDLVLPLRRKKNLIVFRDPADREHLRIASAKYTFKLGSIPVVIVTEPLLLSSDPKQIQALAELPEDKIELYSFFIDELQKLSAEVTDEETKRMISEAIERLKADTPDALQYTLDLLSRLGYKPTRALKLSALQTVLGSLPTDYDFHSLYMTVWDRVAFRFFNLFGLKEEFESPWSRLLKLLLPILLIVIFGYVLLQLLPALSHMGAAVKVP